MSPLVLVNTVGLSGRHVPLAPGLQALAEAGWQRPLGEPLPAVTCTAQAGMLTGKLPREHGIVGNGWLYRDTMEVRFWQQSNHLLGAEPVYVTARRRAMARQRPFRCAKLFWWFNQGAAVDVSVTPKPHYGADGNKAFDILAYPDGLAERLTARLGAFPFPAFWGPMAGRASSRWIGRCAAEVLLDAAGPPELTLVYLPHLDYDTQRLGPERCDWPRLLRELDDACAPILQAARQVGARVWIVNEYAHVQVERAVPINRHLREQGWLIARHGPFGEQLDVYASRAFAVCDHQLAHVYVADGADVPRVHESLQGLEGLARLYGPAQRGEIGLDHARAGELIALAEPDAWFAYPFWLEDRRAPDYARTVDIHRKPGYDPCELFLDPRLWWAKGRVIRRLLQKKLGFRALFDVVPLDTGLVRGSHGLRQADAADRPIMIGDGPAPAAPEHTSVRDLVLEALELAED
jgi:predicted AlkP superfamily pyrophosphatase or phosphodiesterase